MQHTLQHNLLDQYQQDCNRTRNQGLTHEQYYLVGSMGLAGESSETLEVVFRHLNNLQDHITRELLIKELGDIAWYCSDLATTLGLTLGDLPHMDLQHVAEPWRNRQRDAEGFAIHLVVLSGLVLEKVKKHAFHAKKLDEKIVTDAISRILFYITLLAVTVDANLDHILQTNIDKLKVRWPEGFKPK